MEVCGGSFSGGLSGVEFIEAWELNLIQTPDRFKQANLSSYSVLQKRE
jgi:hypothetical protein